jgi:monothiol glutaredoxin
MTPDETTHRRIASLIDSDAVVLFMKGNRSAPQCGFSATVVGILDELVSDYATVDVLSDPPLREGIKAYSSWPTIPQLYVRGEFVGGCDIVQELYASGELYRTLGVEPPRPPRLELSEEAAAALRQLAESREEKTLHLRVDAGFRNALYFGPAQPGELAVEARGVRFRVDPGTARRCDGLRIDLEETPEGPGFRIHNPNDPASAGA